MTKKKILRKKLKNQNWACQIEYHRLDVNSRIKELQDIIKDRCQVIELITAKKKTKKELLSIEIKVMNNCLSTWKKQIKQAEKKIKELEDSKIHESIITKKA